MGILARFFPSRATPGQAASPATDRKAFTFFSGYDATKPKNRRAAPIEGLPSSLTITVDGPINSESECIFGTPCDGDDGPFTLPQTGTCEWGIQDTDPGYCIKGYRAYAINLVYVGGGDACAWTCVIALYDNDNLLGGPELGYTQRTFDPNDPTGIYDLIFDEADGELHCPDAWPATITVT